MMERVWFGSEGSYSDYRVLKVFASREMADRWAEGEAGRFVEPEGDGGFDVVSELSSGVPWLRMHMYYVQDKSTYDRSHDYTEERRWFECDDEPSPPPVKVTQLVRPPFPRSGGGSYPASVSLVVEGADIDRVRKAYSERRAQIIATFDLLVATEAARRGTP